MKITLFIFVNKLDNKGKRKFLLAEPYFCVTCCVEIKVQYFFHKYIFICTIYTLIIQLISAIFYDTCQVHGGSNSWEKPTVSGTEMEQWSVTYLPIGKPKAVDNIASMFSG